MTYVLTDTDLVLLDFEARTYRHQGRRESDALELFGLSPTRYYARLRWICQQPEAMAARPALVRRILRLHEGRQAQRSVRRRTVSGAVAPTLLPSATGWVDNEQRRSR